MRIPHRDRVRNPSALHTDLRALLCMCMGEREGGGRERECARGCMRWQPLECGYLTIGTVSLDPRGSVEG